MRKFKISVKHPGVKNFRDEVLTFAGLKYFDFEGNYALSFAVDGYDEFYRHECYDINFDYSICESTGKVDINGNDIYYDIDVVRFKFFYAGDWIDMQGVFTFNDDELRAEIDIFDHPQGFTCLSYDMNTMKDFEILNIQKNEDGC